MTGLECISESLGCPYESVIVKTPVDCEGHVSHTPSGRPGCAVQLYSDLYILVHVY
jgi:formylmethanofuran:tetrahydromethanopterin formyltransferase